MSAAPIAGVIFDLDGTLVDSRLDFESIRREMGAPEGVGIIEYIDEQADPDHQSQLWDIVEHYERLGAEQSTWIPEAQSTLYNLQKQQLPMAVLTRNNRFAAELCMSKLELGIEHLVCREDCAPKPSPEGLLGIAKAWDIQPENLIYVGDFVFDIQAASNAGMRSCLYQPGAPEPWTKDATWVIKRFSELTTIVAG